MVEPVREIMTATKQERKQMVSQILSWLENLAEDDMRVLSDAVNSKLSDFNKPVDLANDTFGSFVVKKCVAGEGSRRKNNGNRWLTECIACGYSKFFRRGDIARMQDGRASVYECPRCANKCTPPT